MIGMEFKRHSCTLLVEEISSLSIKIFGSLMGLLKAEELEKIEHLVFLDQRVIKKELGNFKKLFKSFSQMVSSNERSVFLHYVK